MEKYYVLRKNEYYLSDIMVEDGKLVNFTVDTEYRKLYADNELAHLNQRIIFIETGLNFDLNKLNHYQHIFFYILYQQ